MFTTVGLVVFLVLLAGAAINDIRCYRIPNAVCLALAGVLPLVRLLEGQVAVLPMAAVAGVVALALGYIAYARGLWGGGDAKLLAAVALWTGFAGMPRFMLVTGVAGGVFALIMLIARKARGGGAVQIPYGVAIAVGGMDWALPQLLLKIQ
ncbi:MAG: prepilin peptidase [Solirubrobacterales bacterium]